MRYCKQLRWEYAWWFPLYVSIMGIARGKIALSEK